MGREVLLVDRCRFPRLKPCGEYYNPDGVRLLRELGVAAAMERAGAQRVDGLALTSRCGGLLVPFASLAPPGLPALTLGREVLDTLLIEEARRAGVTVWEETTLREPLLLRGTVAGAVVSREGTEREVAAAITLAADGLRSRFARRLGLGAGDGGRRKLGLAARYEARAGVPAAVLMSADRSGCCGLAVRGAVANLGMVADGTRAREVGGDPAAFFDRALAQFPDLQACVEGGPTSIRTVGSLTWKTRRQHAAGCLLLGDAGGFYDPFTGQGVTFALLTAKLAAEVTGAALAEQNVSSARLAEYTRRRTAMLAPRVLVQRAIQAVIERPALLTHVLKRLERRPDCARALVSVIADLAPAHRLLSPMFLGKLLG
jgi:flavin-dependent dehydrogenase